LANEQKERPIPSPFEKSLGGKLGENQKGKGTETKITRGGERNMATYIPEPTLWNRIDGNKVYIVAGGMIIYAILGLALGLHDTDRTATLVFAALGMMGFRSAIKKIEEK
jgi:hypothetical protein